MPVRETDEQRNRVSWTDDSTAVDGAIVESPRARSVRSAGRVGQVVYVLLGALDATLIIRFVLKLLAANPAAVFTSVIYGFTQTFVDPFEGVFPTPQTHGSVLEVATLLAIIVYALVAWLVVNLIAAMTGRWTPARPI